MKKDKKDMDTTDQHGKSRMMKAIALTPTQAATLARSFAKGMRHVNSETARKLRNAAASSPDALTVNVHPNPSPETGTMIYNFRDGSTLSVTTEGTRSRISISTKS